MSIFEGTAPPNVETTRVTAAQAPEYLTGFLKDLATAGQTSLQQKPGEMIANLPQNLQDLYANALPVLGRYQAPLTQAAAVGKEAGTAVSPEDVSRFYDPYQQSVLNEIARLSQQNVQRGLMPQLKSAFVGTGGLGGQRYAGAAGQALADVNASLLGKQAELSSAGYKTALDAALREKGLQSQAAQALTGVGQAEAQAGVQGTKALGDIGAQELAYEQSKIEAPLTRAANVAQLLRGYTYPTTTTETYKGPASVYGPSPLSQIAGLGSLIGAAFGKEGAIGNKFLDWLGGLKTPDVSSWEDLTKSNYGTGEDYT